MQHIVQKTWLAGLFSILLCLISGCGGSGDSNEQSGDSDAADTGPIDRHIGFSTVEDAADAYKKAFNDRDWVRLARLHNERDANSISSALHHYLSSTWDTSQPDAFEKSKEYEALWNQTSTPEGVERFNAESYRLIFESLYDDSAKIKSVGDFKELENGEQINATEVMQTADREIVNKVIFWRTDDKVYFSGWSPEIRARY